MTDSMPASALDATPELKARLLEVLNLKEVPREGWRRVGVNRPESVAAHSWGVAWLVLVLCPPELNRERALAMALLHDLAEARVGDITPHDGVSAEDKAQRERKALTALLAPLPHRDELTELWEAYERGSDSEARLVKACDKLDMALQAQRYAGDGVDTAEFIASALKRLELPLHRQLAEGLP